VQVEGEPQRVACGEKVGEAVNVRGYVVGGLGGEAWEELLQGFGEDEWFGWRGVGDGRVGWRGGIGWSGWEWLRD
jgi:hypothetical protein